MVDYKFDEDKYVKEIAEYVDSTYKQHYSGDDKKSTQTMELINARKGRAEGFCIGNILKYADRYEQKGDSDAWRKDIMKVIHYGVLMLYIHDKNYENKERK